MADNSNSQPKNIKIDSAVEEQANLVKGGANHIIIQNQFKNQITQQKDKQSNIEQAFLVQYLQNLSQMNKQQVAKIPQDSKVDTTFEIKKESNLNPRKYQVNMQVENNISRENKMVFLYLYHFSYFDESNQNFPILIDPGQCVFELKQNSVSSNNSEIVLQNFKQQLDKTIVLTYQCKYESEAQAKSYFLNKYQMKQKLSKLLDLRQVSIFPSFTLLQEVLTPKLKQFAEQIAKETPQIIVVGECEQDKNLTYLQNILNQFIENQQNIKKIDQTCQLKLTLEPPDISEINKKLNELSKDLPCEITAITSLFDQASKLYVVTIQIQFWFDSSQEQSQVNSQFQALKNKIEKIYTPNEEINGEIKIWQNLLSEEFESAKNSPESQTNKSQCVAKIESREDIQVVILGKKMVKQLVTCLSDQKLQNIIDLLKQREIKLKQEYYAYYFQLEKKQLLAQLKEKIQEIEKLTNQINQYKATTTQSFSIDCPKKLIFQKMLLYLQNKEQDYKQVFTQDSKIFFTLTKTRQQKEAAFAVDQARQQLKNMEKKLIESQSGFSFKEIKYIRKNLAQKLLQYEKEHEMIFSFNQSEQPKQVRGFQYQWQWYSDYGFINYDDEDVNKQIDHAYQQFLVTKQEYKVNVHFPFSKQPGTHKVDLVNQKLTQISITKDIPFCYKMINNQKKYYINNQPVPDQLTEYFILQESKKQTVFTIFYSCYFVVFNDKEMYQMNSETKYKRQIQPAKNYLEEQQIVQQSQHQQMSIISFDSNLNQKIIQSFKQDLTNAVIIKTYQIPSLIQEDLQTLQSFIQKNSNKIIGNVAKDSTIKLEIFKAKEYKIQENINLFKPKMKQQYPLQWVYQSENFIKHSLSPYEQEYKMVMEHFRKSDQGQVHEIRRIQNKALWDNYITEKNKLLNIYQQLGNQLTQIEQERYFWHGVRGQHPKVIYSGLKEAFDQSYSNGGNWGTGIYFAENASYSRGFSYTLTQQDDPTHVGKKIFLYCLVTTGKVEPRASDRSIKRPSAGYDCVSSTCKTQFILYSMDIRRAYPAYEVIFT